MYVVVAIEGSFLKEHKNLKLFCCTQQGRVTEVFYQLSPPPNPLLLTIWILWSLVLLQRCRLQDLRDR